MTAALEEQARSLAELRETVVELEARPVGDPELDERLARTQTQFADGFAAKPDSDQVEALAARLEGLEHQVEGFASTLGDVRQGLTALEDAGAPRRLDELGQSLAAARDRDRRFLASDHARRPDRAHRPSRRGADSRAPGPAGVGPTSRRNREQADGGGRHTRRISPGRSSVPAMTSPLLPPRWRTRPSTS